MLYGRIRGRGTKEHLLRADEAKHEERGNNFLGDIIEDIEAGYEEEVHSRITDAIINQSNELENFIKKSISDIVAESTRFCDPPFINKLPEHAYKILTSANYHNRLHTRYPGPRLHGFSVVSTI